ncbi:DUF6233 domain-containing protein [Streptomyces sp. NBC_01304]|uniref:DUF6233 domain-containing protein n=1 Tax=Streptomyces sp. NBC_01304 TaxID=2903818 RepID=UPI002E0ECFCB|nr:DUF6233 domain-containing protein [Streptomyces sp. NBC_01304]
MTQVPDDAYTPLPVRVVMPHGEELRGRLHERQQMPDGSWQYRTGVDVWNNDDAGRLEVREYMMWLVPGLQVLPVEGIEYDSAVVPTTRLPPPSAVEEILGERRPSGWVLQRLVGSGPDRAVLHAPDCDEAPSGAPALSVDQALSAAEDPRTRLCALCGAGAELDPLIKGFAHGFDVDE